MSVRKAHRHTEKESEREKERDKRGQTETAASSIREREGARERGDKVSPSAKTRVSGLGVVPLWPGRAKPSIAPTPLAPKFEEGSAPILLCYYRHYSDQNFYMALVVLRLRNRDSSKSLIAAVTTSAVISSKHSETCHASGLDEVRLEPGLCV